jgi:hypothetical protein
MLEKPSTPESGRVLETAPSRKRRYAAPSLTEYGSIGKLTQGGSGTIGEGSGGMAMAMCL